MASSPLESGVSTPGLKKALWYCWSAVLILPVAGLAMTGGPCGGPDGVAGSIVLLGVGVGCLALVRVGILGVSREFRSAPRDLRAWCVISAIVAGLASLAGIAFTLVGLAAAESFRIR
jgi:hypothetical protein